MKELVCEYAAADSTSAPCENRVGTEDRPLQIKKHAARLPPAEKDD